MSSSRAQLACAALLLSCACHAGLAPRFAPAPRAMEPRGGSGKSTFTARVSGDFYVVGAEQLAGSAGFVVSRGFTAFLDGVPVAVEWLGPHALSAQVPAGLSDGPHALTVHAPTGMQGTLQAAWTTSEATPAQLSAAASTVVPQLSVGQVVPASLTVTNTGGTIAQAVTPALSQSGAGAFQILAAPAPMDIAPGATASFAWSLAAATPGATSLSLSAGGTDTLSGLPVAVAPLPAGTVVIQAAASLTGGVTASQAQVSVGQTVTFTLAVTNTGEATALGVAPAAPVIGGGAGVTAPTNPAAQDVPGGQSRIYVWTYTTTSSGTVDFSVAASGTDQNSGQPVACASSGATVTVQKPPVLAAALSSPTLVNVGDVFTVSLTVTNNGEATALGVAPAGFSPSPTGAVQLQGGPVPASATVAGGSSQIFTWTLKAVAVQPAPGVSFSSSTVGTDANSGKALPAATASSATAVQTPAALTSSFSVPSVVNKGDPISVTLTVTNSGDSAANAVVPSALTLGGTAGAATLVSGPSPASATVSGHGSATFTWSYTANVGAGTVTFSGGASGSDATNSSAVAAPSTSSAAVTLQMPASLTGSFSVPSVVNKGDPISVSLTVTNSGDSAANAVVPSALTVGGTSGAGAATLVSGPAPASTTVAGHGSATFAWSYTANLASGTVTFSGGASGKDATNGNAVAAASTTSAAVTLQAAAALTGSFSVPAVVNKGDPISVVLTVTNSGDSAANAVVPSALTLGGTSSGGATLVSGPSPASATVSGHGSATFTWSYTANLASGTVTFSGGASGKDATNGNAVAAASTTSAAVTLQAAAALTGSFSVPAVVNQGDPISVVLTVTNSGDSAANAVVPSALTLGGTAGAGAATLVSGPSPASATVAGHGSTTFTWSYTANLASGTVTFSGGASGKDATDGNAVAAASTTSPAVTLQAPAALSATLTLPASVATGATFTATLVVTNSGGASANNVMPPAAGPTATTGNTGSATLTSAAATPPGPVNIAGGTSATFKWNYTAGGSGIFGISVSVSGTDGTDGAALSASASGSTQIGQVVLITGGSTPFPGTVPTNFSYVFSYQNQVWLGPSGDGSGALRSNYDGSNTTSASFQLEWDPGAGTTFSAARNSAWSVTSPALTVGYLNCAQMTTACGPDNEMGRGLFFSGVLNGVEWLMLSGARPTGGTRFLYMTNGSFPLTSTGRDDFAFVALQNVVHGSTVAATAGLTFENAVYLGSADTGTTGGSNYAAPVMTRIINAPALPGLNAVAGTDAVDLNLVAMPYLGVNGNPANPLRDNKTSTALMVDSITGFGTAPNDALYIANNGGWARSLKNLPAPCASSGNPACPDWIATTPSSVNYTAKTSISPPAAKTSDFEPQDKAVPAMASFGGRLFAARNTTLGPQLWSCTPGQTMAGAPATTGAVQCGPGDWTLVGGNSALGLDAQLTQMNSSYTAISMLVAAGGYLYVGFNNTSAAGLNNPNPGVGIYRTSNPATTSLADFYGLNGCSPAGLLPTSPCQGIGGNGFGQATPPTHIFDGKALVSNGNTYLYVSAGTGTSTAAVYRVAP